MNQKTKEIFRFAMQDEKWRSIFLLAGLTVLVLLAIVVLVAAMSLWLPTQIFLLAALSCVACEIVRGWWN